jgi:serine phosphatase RsbU (regulator of sigma subunit)
MGAQTVPAELELTSMLPAGLFLPGTPHPPEPRLDAGQVIEGAPGNAYHLSLPLDLAAVRPHILEGLQFLLNQGVAAEDLTACELALVEACNNAILYSADRITPVGIELICHADRIDLQVVDHTQGFDWPAKMELPDREVERGRGLFLIQSVMDEALYLRSHRENRLCMRKQRQAAPARAEAPGQEMAEMEKQLALSRQVLSNMANELCAQVMRSRVQQQEMDDRLLAHELEIARKIQESLLPKTFPPLHGFSLSGFCLSARQVGGDFYDLIEMPAGRVLLVVADVMGKGVPAALFAATLRTLLRTATQWTQSTSELLARINRLMYEELAAVDMFITAQLAIADTREGLLQVASAGHNPLLCVALNGSLQAISPEGLPLGILPEFQFEERTVSLDNLGAALMFTDGLTEARNADGDLFGQERLINWLVESRRTCRTARQLTDNFLGELARFQGACTPRDDQTFLVISREANPCVHPESSLVTPCGALPA